MNIGTQEILFGLTCIGFLVKISFQVGKISSDFSEVVKWKNSAEKRIAKLEKTVHENAA